MKLPNVQNSRISQKNYPIFGGKDPFAAAGIRPELALDFEQQRFRQGANTTAPNVYTATRTGLATQLDASGNLVWNAHNLIPYSEQFDNAIWIKQVSSTVVANTEIAPDGTLTADTLNLAVSASSAIRQQNIPPSGEQTFSVWAKCTSGTETFRLLSFNSTDGQVNSPDFTVTTEWQKFSLTYSPTVANSWYISNSSAGGVKSIIVWGAHLYRSDLGGMAPVPLTRRVAGSTTYVPTTSAAVYLPREEAYTYVSGSLVGPYYQKESDARTNLVTYSEDVSGQWNQPRVTSTTGTGTGFIGPDGLESLTLVAETTETGVHGVFQGSSSSSSSGVEYTLSTHLRKGTGATAPDWIQITFVASTHGTNQYANFNLSTGEFGNVVGGSAKSENLGNGLYRISFTSTSNGVGPLSPVIGFTNNEDISQRTLSYAGVTTSDVFVGASQVEQGSTPTSYIPTSGSTVTRSADSTTISAGNMPAYTNALSFQMEGLMTYAASTDFATSSLLSWKKDPTNEILYNIDTLLPSLTGQLRVRQKDSGVTDEVKSSAAYFSPGINVPFNISSRHGSTFVNAAVDGTALTADTTPTALPDLSAATFDLAPTFNGFIKEFRVWADDIGDSGIAEAST